MRIDLVINSFTADSSRIHRSIREEGPVEFALFLKLKICLQPSRLRKLETWMRPRT